MENVSKKLWTEMFEEIGLTQDAMQQWHTVFETRAPKAHQGFLEWLNIPAAEIKEIRAKSKP